MMVAIPHNPDHPLNVDVKRARAGFTLVETMMALLIMVLLTAIVATGIPVAFETYNKAVGASNAQSALSTTVTLLRDELGSAQDFKPTADGKNVRYLTNDGYWAMIENPASGYGVGLLKQAYGADGDPSKPYGDPQKLTPEALVKGKNQADGQDGAANDLRVEFETITCSDGVFIVHGLQVTLPDGTVVASVGEGTGGDLKIRAAML